MSKTYIECSEVVGKTVRSMRFYAAPEDGIELVAEFSDGSAVSYSVEAALTSKAIVYQTGIDEPKIIKRYPPMKVVPCT